MPAGQAFSVLIGVFGRASCWNRADIDPTGIWLHHTINKFAVAPHTTLDARNISSMLRIIPAEVQAALNNQLSWVWSITIAVAYALLDGIGVEENPMAAIVIALRSNDISEFELGKIIVKANLRLVGRVEYPVRCMLVI